jgi:hypothetical protein
MNNIPTLKNTKDAPKSEREKRLRSVLFAAISSALLLVGCGDNIQKGGKNTPTPLDTPPTREEVLKKEVAQNETKSKQEQTKKELGQIEPSRLTHTGFKLNYLTKQIEKNNKEAVKEFTIVEVRMEGDSDLTSRRFFISASKEPKFTSTRYLNGSIDYYLDGQLIASFENDGEEMGGANAIKYTGDQEPGSQVSPISSDDVDSMRSQVGGTVGEKTIQISVGANITYDLIANPSMTSKEISNVNNKQVRQAQDNMANIIKQYGKAE